MKKDFYLEEMTLDEMWSLHGQLCRALADRLTQEKRELERRLAQLNREQLITGPEGFESLAAAGTPVRRKYPRVYPKYRNPDSPYETWSGRGKQPRWIVTALEAGRSVEEFTISPEDAEPEDSNRPHS
jgi:DNA-binding protein H-NS